MNKAGAKRALLLSLALLLSPAAAFAAISSYTLHSGVSISSALSIAEVEAVRFGNFTVTSPGSNDAEIVLGIDGSRSASSGSTVISLLGGASPGSAGAGYYQITNAGAGAALYISFTDSTGAAITAGNPVFLTGPVGSGKFAVDSFIFNLDGSDVTGDYINAGGSGNATIRIGATLHTVTGVSTYAPGVYTGTFEILVAY